MRRFGTSKMHLSLPVAWAADCSKSVVLFLWVCTLLNVHSSLAIILVWGGLVALLSMSSWCLVIVVWVFLAVSLVCLCFVIVVFPGHTHLLFLVKAISY